MNKPRPIPESDEPFLAVPLEEAEKKIGDRISQGMALKLKTIASEPQLHAVKEEYWRWSDYNTELLARLFTTRKYADEYSMALPMFIASGERYLHEEVVELHNDIDHKLRRLRSIKDRLELIPHASSSGGETQSRAKASAVGDKVFIVHGHDAEARESVGRVVEKLGLTPIILHEQPNQGRTVIEKLEHNSDVAFAIVLLTPDDVGGVEKDSLRPRARQNVILELGYFVGRLGRGRVCALHRGDLELPSDIIGVVYVPYDDGGGWVTKLGRELRTAGFSIDMNAVI